MYQRLRVELKAKKKSNLNIMRRITRGISVYLFILSLVNSEPPECAEMVEGVRRDLSKLRDEYTNLEAKYTAIDGSRLYNELNSQLASKEATRMLNACSNMLSCNSCLQSGCAWCLGERACVPDEPWLCQGEEDHVGNLGDHKVCPEVEDPVTEKVGDPVEVKVKDPDPTKVSKNEMEWSSHNIDGTCKHKPDSSCFGAAICECGGVQFPSTSKEKPTHKCLYGSSHEVNGCCNCDCGECDDVCQTVLVSVEKAEVEIMGDGGQKDNISEKIKQEILRIKLDLQDGGTSDERSGTSDQSDDKDQLRCDFIEEQVRLFKDDDTPYFVLNVTDDSTTSEIRRAYRRTSLLYHPDKVNMQLCGEAAAEAFAFLVTAYEILSDPDKRASFDDFGDGEAEHFYSQWEYEQSGRTQNKDFYRGSKHITNIDEKLWKKLNDPKNGRGAKIWLIEFYAPWCGGCLEFAARYKELAKYLVERDDNQIEIGAINCEVNKRICQEEFNLRRYPTVRLVNPFHGTQHELDHRDHNMKENILEVAEEWVWLFARSQVNKLVSREEFLQNVIEDKENFHIVSFLDGLTCGPCKSARTNALRLSAGLLGHEGARNVTVSFFDCSLDRDFCREAGVSSPPFAPQLFGYKIGEKKFPQDGELLYNSNEVPPHAALQLIESIIRLSSKMEEEALVADLGSEARWDEGEEEEDDDLRHQSNDRFVKKDGKKKLMWNGPSSRPAVLGGGGGGRGRARQLIG